MVWVTYLTIMHFYGTLHYQITPCQVPMIILQHEVIAVTVYCYYNSQKFVHDNSQGEYKLCAFTGDYRPKTFCFHAVNERKREQKRID